MYPGNKQDQPELFDKLSGADMMAGAGKPQQRKLSPFKRLTIATTYETGVVVCILLLMAMILSFAIGFERGKKISKQPQEKQPQEVTKVTSEQSPVVAKAGKPKPEPEQKKRNFAVQLIAYAKKDHALKELEKLKKAGYAPFVVQDGKFFLISIGPYADHRQASRVLKKIKSQSLYHDAFIKRILKE